MRNCVHFTVIGLAVVLSVVAATAATPEQAAAVWEKMRAVDIDSKRFTEAKAELQGLIQGAEASQRVPMAVALMEWGSPDAINATALQMFGTDGLPFEDVRALLDAEARYTNTTNAYPQQRVLLRTYWRFLRPEYETKLSEPMRRKLVGALARHVRALAKQKKVTYGEQRLVTHMIEAVLSRYAASTDVREMAALREAMDAYVKAHADGLALAMSAWMKMKPDMKIRSTDNAIVALGHWEPLTRMKAQAELGAAILGDPSVADRSSPSSMTRATRFGRRPPACSASP